MLFLDVSVLLEAVLPLDVFFLQHWSSLSCPLAWASLFYKCLCRPGRACCTAACVDLGHVCAAPRNSSERNSESFMFRGTVGIPSELTISSVYSVFRGRIILSEIANPAPYWAALHPTELRCTDFYVSWHLRFLTFSSCALYVLWRNTYCDAVRYVTFTFWNFYVLCSYYLCSYA